jgi:nicotinate phosphoribosyltransferase
MAPIIRSLLDTDWYKITMGQVIYNQFPAARVRYEFINRGGTSFPPGFADKLCSQINHLSTLRLQDDELDWLKIATRYMKPAYFEWFHNYRFNPTEVTIRQEGGDLQISIEGPWYRTVFWEVPLMATISELYFRETRPHQDPSWLTRYKGKVAIFLKYGVRWADFGTRRRYSAEIQDQVVKTSAGVDGFLGTSNPHFARLYQVTLIGTYAHEAVMAMQARYGIRHCNTAWMEAWVKEYQGDLGIALGDTVTTRYFLQTFPKLYAKLFDGIRQDSGDPHEVGRRILAYYRRHGIDPLSKNIVFSDNLNPDKTVELQREFSPQTRVLFGIGTNLTNDVGAKPLNMVIKLVEADLGYGMVPVVKVSDDAGKHTGNKLFIEQARRELSLIS